MQKSKTYFGEYGGRYVPEMLQPVLEELAEAYDSLRNEAGFIEELQLLQTSYNNRPTPLVFAERLSRQLDGAQIYLKNEGLNHTGAHKINHCLGQALVARRLKKKRLIAETGAGQHGIATATVAARLGFKCTIYMGEIDVARQQPNVIMMRLLGADVVSVPDGAKTLKDAVNAAMRDLLQHSDTSHYVIGSCLGPDPYPRMNRDFQSIISKEIRSQLGKLPDYVVACVGGGSNALGAFHDFLQDPVQLIAVEAGGKGKKVGQHAKRIPNAKVGIIEGYKSYFLQDRDGNSAATHSIAAGLDYIGLGPELSYLADSGRVDFRSSTDRQALHAVRQLALYEGIIPALESAHAMAAVLDIAPTLSKDKIIVVNISGRGDKDIFTLGHELFPEEFGDFLRNEVQRYE